MSEEETGVETPTTIEEVLVTMMQMVQYYTNHINYEMLRLLHEGGHCGRYVDMCLLCKHEEELATQDNTVQTTLDVVSEEE